MFKTSLLAGLALVSFVAPVKAEETRSLYFTVGAGKSMVSELEGDTTISGTLYDLEADMKDSFLYELGVGKHLNKNCVIFLNVC